MSTNIITTFELYHPSFSYFYLLFFLLQQELDNIR